MSGRQEPRSKHRHDPALEKYKKARQDMHPGFQPTSRRTTRAASSAAAQYVSTKYGRQSTEGGARGGRLSVGCV